MVFFKELRVLHGFFLYIIYHNFLFIPYNHLTLNKNNKKRNISY